MPVRWDLRAPAGGWIFSAGRGVTIARSFVAMPDKSEDDIALLDRVVARDQQAIAELYERHSRLLFGLILRILRDREEAEDVLQEVFLAAWTRAETYKASLGTPAGWLVRIARNRAIDRLRANSSRLRAIEAGGTPAAEARSSPDGEAQRDVARALDALPVEQRSLIEEAFFRGLTHSELAARFSIPLGTVKTRVRTGLLALRQYLQESYIVS
jgi:RNA polymerase sigma-70 factor, ECF subfamily